MPIRTSGYSRPDDPPYLDASMAIRFTDKPPENTQRRPEGPPPRPAPGDETPSEGEARFATPIEATKPVNPDAGGQLPFADLPPAEKAARSKRGPRTPRK